MIAIKQASFPTGEWIESVLLAVEIDNYSIEGMITFLSSVQISRSYIVQGKFALTWQIFPSKLQIGLYHLQGVGKGKKKLTPLALEGFEKIDFNFWKKSIYK